MTKVRDLLLVAILVFVVAFTVYLPAAAALRFVALPKGMTYRSVQGSVWHMRFHDVALFGRPIGILELSLSPLSIMGSTQGTAKITGPDMRAEFVFAFGETLLVDKLFIATDIQTSLMGLAASGTADISDAYLVLDPSGRCREATGRLETDVFRAAFTAFGVASDMVTANLRCDSGVLSFAFSRQLDGGVLDVQGWLARPQEINLAMQLRFDDQARMPHQWIDGLGRAGFQATDDGWRAEVRVPL